MSGDIVQLTNTILAGTEISQNTTEKDVLTLTLAPLFIIRSEGIPGVDAGTRWKQKGLLHFRAATLVGAPTKYPAELRGGKAKMNQFSHIDMLPIPCESPGVIVFQLDLLGSDQPIIIHSEYVRLELVGPPKYISHIQGMGE